MNDPAAPAILVVDDDPVARAMLVDVLEDAGYMVQGAPDGEVALAMLRAAPTRFGLVLLDLMMPLVDGWLFRRMQLADPHIAAIPVVALSASTIALSHGLPQGLSRDNFLPKPSDSNTVLAAVGRHLAVPRPQSIEVADPQPGVPPTPDVPPLAAEWICTANQVWVCVVSGYHGIITPRDMLWRARVEDRGCMIPAEITFARLEAAKAWVEATIAGLTASDPPRSA
ncbi:MAG: response regulator [Chloroflexota bacterium]|nr:response regulator [Chloroflexota bacterium]